MQQFQTNRPISNLYFSPGSNQRNFLIKTQFSRPFKNQLQLTIDYQRILAEGIYTSQSTRSTNLGVSLWKKYDNHDLIITAISNTNNEQHNGGVSTDSLFRQAFYNFRTRIPTYIEDGTTRHANQEIAINNYFKLKRFEGIAFRNEIAFERGTFKYFDESVDDIDLFYGDYNVEDRGIRNFVDYLKLESTLYGQLSFPQFDLNAGINYSFYNIDQVARSSTFNDISLLGDFRFKLVKQFDLSSTAYLGIGSNVGEYSIRPQADFDFIKNLNLQLYAIFERKRPSVTQQAAYVNELALWENDFTNPLINTLGAKASFTPFGLEAEFKQIALTNPIYFDLNAKPAQADATILISQFIASSNHNWKSIYFENQIGLQNLSDNIYNLPSFLSEHELYWQNYIFKKRMFTRVGARLRTVNSYMPTNYNPVLGIFYAQNEESSPLLYQWDAYINFKIDKVRVFLRGENLSQLITGNVFELVNDYPIFDFKFRMGISWQMLD